MVPLPLPSSPTALGTYLIEQHFFKSNSLLSSLYLSVIKEPYV